MAIIGNIPYFQTNPHENHHFGVNLGEFHGKKLKWHGDFGWIAGLKTENIELKNADQESNHSHLGCVGAICGYVGPMMGHLGMLGAKPRSMLGDLEASNTGPQKIK